MWPEECRTPIVEAVRPECYRDFSIITMYYPAVTNQRACSLFLIAIGMVVVVGLSAGVAWAEDCTVSNEFQLIHPQILRGVLENGSFGPVPFIKLELLARRSSLRTVIANNKGEYSFGKLPAGRYRISLGQQNVDVFCAPKIKCNEVGCSIDAKLNLNPKFRPPEIEY